MSESSRAIYRISRREFLRVAAGAAGATLLGACGGGSNGCGNSDDPSIALGVCTALAGSSWATAIETYHTKAGAYPASLVWYQDWGGYPTFQRPIADAAVAVGAVPQLTWQPQYTTGGNQADFALAKIASGAHDSYLTSYADAVASWGKRLYIRFAHEMNGDWYPWSPGLYGNTSADYGAAWRHIHATFAARGATNVRWVWCPNSEGANNHLLPDLYPGDAYVDWVGLDGYNWGDTRAGTTWRSLYTIFQANYETLVAMTKKPFMIGETASAESGGDKAAWIRQGLLDDLPTCFPRIAWVQWFDILKEADWRINSSQAALQAYRQVVTSPLYRGARRTPRSRPSAPRSPRSH